MNRSTYCLILILINLINLKFCYSQFAAPEMVDVFGGEFMAGYTAEQAPDGQWNVNYNVPSHKVEISDYKVSKYEVTQELFESIMGDNPGRFAYAQNLPIENIDYITTIIFCNELSLSQGMNISDLVYFKDSLFTIPYLLSDYLGNGISHIGVKPPFWHHIHSVYQNHKSLGYRMPTDAEWEYAARGGHLNPIQTKYSGGSDLNLIAWNTSNSNSKIHPVGELIPNALGIYDMNGNVSERTSYSIYEYSIFPKCNPTRLYMDLKENIYNTFTPSRGGDIVKNVSLSNRKSELKRNLQNPISYCGIRLAQSVEDSRECPLPAEIGLVKCHDNGTPSDSTDDTFTFDVEINKHENMVTWIANDPHNTHGKYYAPFTMGPYNISDGGFGFVIRDSVSNGFVTDSLVIVAPATCSNELPSADIESEMIPVYRGVFTAGATSEQMHSQPLLSIPHKVEIWDFKIAKYETTIAQFEEIMGNVLSMNPYSNNAPVHNIDFITVLIFCNEYSLYMGLDSSELVYYKDSLYQQPYTLADYFGNGEAFKYKVWGGPHKDPILQDHSKLGYRLPTEAEWEYAARGGHIIPVQTKYAGSDIANDVAWYDANTLGNPQMPVVGQKQPNHIGTYDMSGNACEYTSYEYSAFTKDTKCNPTRIIYSNTSTELSAKKAVALRGGHVYSNNKDLIISKRHNSQMSDKESGVQKQGFRLAQSVGDSRECPLPAEIGLVKCHDNGTPSNPNDDTFTFDVEINKHENMVTWIANDPHNTHGKYYAPFTMGPYNISDGGFGFVIRDSVSNGFVTDSFVIVAPATCSICDEINSNLTYEVCSNEIVTVNNITYNQAGTFTQTLSATNGCDSILTINIAMKDVISSLQEFSICQSESVTVNNISYNQEGTFTQELIAANGCDSILTIKINIKENTSSEQSYEICSGDIITVNNIEYNQVGIYSQTLTNALGCDSTITINVTPSNNCIINCTIIAEIINVNCDDNSTPFDPTDDLFFSNVLLSGSDVTTHWTSNDNIRPIGNYNSIVTFGPYQISNGIFELQFSDAVNICETSIQINPPTTCSDLCIINADIITIVCNDNESPSNADDDTYTAVLNVSSVNGSTFWNSDDIFNQSGEYGVITFGPYNIADGDKIITFTDSENGNCPLTINLEAPPVCSQSCDVFTEITSIYCDDNGSANINDDDMFFVTLKVSGNNLSGNWSADDQYLSSGINDVEVTLGPYSISQGDFNLRIIDAKNENCFTDLWINAPLPCSNECQIQATVSQPYCDNNGTSTDPYDDVFYFELNVDGVNTSSDWYTNGDIAYTQLYNQGSVIFGPLNITEGEINFDVVDGNNSECNTTVNVTAPATCSDVCELTSQILNVNCDNAGSASDNSDDVFYANTIIDIQNGNGIWYSDDANVGFGSYGTVITFGPYLIGNGDVNVAINNETFSCNTTLHFIAPTSCSNSCELNHEIQNVRCDDNGTPSDHVDDVFFAQIKVNGSNTGNGFVLENINMTYDEWHEVGPFYISSGNAAIEVNDDLNTNCKTTIQLTAPASCSDQCEITIKELDIKSCTDNNTPSNNTDDVFSTSFIVEGKNNASQCRVFVDAVEHGIYNYNQTIEINNLGANGVLKNIKIEDVTDVDCNYIVEIQRESCSTDCPPPFKEADVHLCTSTTEFELNSSLTNLPSATWICKSGPEILTITNSKIDLTNKSTGNYLFQLKKNNYSFCDSIISELKLELRDTIHEFINVKVCDFYNWNGQELNESGTYQYKEKNQFGCDSTVTLNLTIPSSFHLQLSATICDSYTWHGDNYTESGIYSFATQTIDGCDSIETLNLTVNKSSLSVIEETKCKSFTWNGNEYTESGLYLYSTHTTNGCDSTVFLDLRISDEIKNETSLSTCDSYNWNGNNYSESGTYTFNALTVDGCDSIEILNLTINKSNVTTLFETKCKSFNWHGNNYTESGIYSFATQTAAGCDSSVFLNLTISEEIKNETSLSICDSYNWNGNNYSESGIYTFNAITVDGCDSIETLNLTINKSSISTIFETSCKSYEWNGIEYTESGIYSYAGKTTNGCDSIVTLNLTIPSSYQIKQSTEICQGDSVLFNNQWFKDNTNLEVNQLTQQGCDSTIIFELKVVDQLQTESTLNICKGDSIKIFDEWKSEEGSYSKNFQSLGGCDSLSQVLLLVNSVFVNSKTQNICSGDSIFIFNEWKSKSGFYTQYLKTNMGCDSIEHVELIVNPLIVKSDSLWMCNGDSIVINGSIYSDEGNYQSLFTSSNGCDSIYNFSILFSPLITKTENYSICEGDSVLINGSFIYKSETLKYFIEEENCKTEVTAIVNLNPSATSIQQYTICPNDSILINNVWIKENSEFSYTLQSTQGCDSTIQVIVSKTENPNAPIVQLNCEEENYIINIENNDWQVLWSNGSIQSSILIENNYIEENNSIGLMLTDSASCVVQYTIPLEIIPQENQIPKLNDLYVSNGENVEMDIPLNDSEWTVLWNTTLPIDCDSCLQTLLHTTTNSTVEYLLTHQTGCTFVRSFDVFLNDNVEETALTIAFPNVISLHSTGVNNIWTILIPEGLIIKSAKVYDRWGNTLYASTGKIYWDGTFKGEYVLPGVYVYVVEIIKPDNTIVVYKGDITIIK